MQIEKTINTSKPYGLRALRCFCVVEKWLETGSREAWGILRPFPFEGVAWMKSTRLQGVVVGKSSICKVCKKEHILMRFFHSI